MRCNDARGKTARHKSRGRIDGVQLVPVPQAGPRRTLLAAAPQASEQRFVKGVRLLGVDARQRRATDGSHAEMIKLAPLGIQVAHDVPWALSARPLRHTQGRELRPAVYDAQPLAALVLASLGVECMPRKEPEELREDCAMMGPACIVCFLNDLCYQSFYRTGEFQAAFIGMCVG